jgi:hypothetical protein
LVPRYYHLLHLLHLTVASHGIGIGLVTRFSATVPISHVLGGRTLRRLLPHFLSGLALWRLLPHLLGGLALQRAPSPPLLCLGGRTLRRLPPHLLGGFALRRLTPFHFSNGCHTRAVQI